MWGLGCCPNPYRNATLDPPREFLYFSFSKLFYKMRVNERVSKGCLTSGHVGYNINIVLIWLYKFLSGKQKQKSYQEGLVCPVGLGGGGAGV